MVQVTYISGGQRSGKSSQAMVLAEALHLERLNADVPSQLVYLATSEPKDDQEMQNRVSHHQLDRENRSFTWQTIEQPIRIDALSIPDHAIVVMDCVTLWLSNLFFANNTNPEQTLEAAQAIWTSFRQKEFSLFVVSNEIGMGVIPASDLSRRFVDVQGFMNQQISSHADKAIFMVSGRAIALQ